MILLALIVIPFYGGILAAVMKKSDGKWPRIVSLILLSIDFIIVSLLWVRIAGGEPALTGSGYYYELKKNWIPELGITLHLAVDGLSILLCELTVFFGLVAVVSTWNERHDRNNLFHFNLLWVIGGMLGVFCSFDLFLFYFFWELMIVPMFIMINNWGRSKSSGAAITFFIFTQASGLLMLLAILGLYFVHGRETGVYTFDLLGRGSMSLPASASMLIMLGFVVAFAVKMPVLGLHPWQPGAYAEAPTAGSILLAAVMSKTGVYGLLRIVGPLFPDSFSRVAAAGMWLGVAGILYGGFVAYSQPDFKRFIAYTSVSHLGFIFLGVFTANELALQGIVVLVLSHALSAGALFMLAGYIQERVETLDMGNMGGYATIFPRMSGFGIFFAVAAMGLPSLGNFVGEFLILLGAFAVRPVVASVAALGLIVSVIYAVLMVRNIFHGPEKRGMKIGRLSVREAALMMLITALLLVLGLFPRPVFNTMTRSLKNFIQTAQTAADTSAGPEKIGLYLARDGELFDE
jgi:NADH-quinone oxidoreductase subunit M